MRYQFPHRRREIIALWQHRRWADRGHRLLFAPLAAFAIGIALLGHPAEARTITANGTLKPIASVTLGSKVSGTIQDIECEVNSPVKKGQVCARIDPRPFERAVEMARANLAAAVALLHQHSAALTYAKANYERNSSLAERGVVSKNAFESIQSTYSQTQAQIELDKAVIEQRKAQLAAAELDLAYTEVISPIDGIVLQRMMAVGETVASSFQTPSLFVISKELSQMQLVALVDEGEVGEIKAGDRVSFSVKAFPNRQFVGKIGQIGNTPVTVLKDIMYEVVVDVENKDLALRPGMTAVLKVDTR